MKKLVVLTLMLLATFSASAKKDWKGKVVDQNGDPVAYANVAVLGYKTVYLSPVDGMIITLADDTAMLEGAVATAIMPKTQLTGEGLQTNVRGSVLENLGNANDVLARTPGLVKGQNGLEVIGKGAPLVFINGRKVTDASELQRHPLQLQHCPEQVQGYGRRHGPESPNVKK